MYFFLHCWKDRLWFYEGCIYIILFYYISVYIDDALIIHKEALEKPYPPDEWEVPRKYLVFTILSTRHWRGTIDESCSGLSDESKTDHYVVDRPLTCVEL